MNKLKLRNDFLEKENSMLKSKLIEMGMFSKRMVEITAEMDNLLNQRTIQIEQIIPSSTLIDTSSEQFLKITGMVV